MSEEAAPGQVPSPWDPLPGESQPVQPPQQAEQPQQPQPLLPPGAFPPPPGTQYGAVQYGSPQYGAQYGQGQYGQPLPMYPAGPYAGSPYGPGPYGYGTALLPAPPTTSGMAIASLVLGICGFFCVTPFVGLGLGIAALVQTSKTGRPGKGMAIAGVILSSAWILLLVLLLATGHYSGSGSGPSTDPNQGTNGTSA